MHNIPRPGIIHNVEHQESRHRAGLLAAQSLESEDKKFFFFCFFFLSKLEMIWSYALVKIVPSSRHSRSAYAKNVPLAHFLNAAVAVLKLDE